MKIPREFLEKLESNQELDGIVKLALTDFGKILDYNEFYFFRGYTDHSIKHIENILSSSLKLITENSLQKVLTHHDVAYYILVVILHDLGMHISLDGFAYLIDGNFDEKRIQQIDKYTWGQLWEEFIAESKKFSGKQLNSLFGLEDAFVRTPPIEKPGEINENDKKLIGEFIRRHHSRLAHEIALNGFPGSGSVISFASQLSWEVRNMIGIIARSHGMDLRTSMDSLEAFHGRYNRRNPYNTHAVFLMVLIRIADYIQIDSGRTSRTILKLKSLNSEASEMEHKAHLAIDYIDDRYQDDPERINVQASPLDSKMYLKLKNLFKNIQLEMDISWAVLGEIYGHISERPEIKFRRITSNLDDNNFIKSKDYLADSFAFTANDEIIKLLIAPLYGDNPTFGVRELLQNSIDACNERKDTEIKLNNIAFEPKVLVEVKQKEKKFIFSIRDNGIGMNAIVIKNYLLSAGASYRKSFEWRKEFIDSNGDTQIRRTGRFGIGILAAFLIGKELKFETKKIGEKYGYRFEATLNSEQINILKDENIPIGTFVEIIIDEKSFDKLRPDKKNDIQWYQWFTLKVPVVEYYWLGKKLPFEKFNPDIEGITIDWASIELKGFTGIQWTYSTAYSNRPFSCNGIVIPLKQYQNYLDIGLLSNKPHLNVFDNNGILPLTLDRNSLADKLPFSNELLTDIYKDLIAYLLVFDFQGFADDEDVILQESKLDHPALKTDTEFGFYYFGYSIYNYAEVTNIYRGYLKWLVNRILFSKKGFILNYNYFINKLNKVEAIFIQGSNFTTLQNRIHLDLKEKFLFFTTDKINSIDAYANAIDPKDFNISISALDYRFYLKSDKYEYIFDQEKKRVSRWLKDNCKKESELKGWTSLTIGNPNKSIVSSEFLKLYSSKLNFIREYTITAPLLGDLTLNQLLERYLGDAVVIPFSLEERRKKYPLAFGELVSYMKKYQKLNQS